MSRYRVGDKEVEIYNLSDLEDIPGSFEIIGQIAAKAGKSAATEAKVAGLSQIFARNNQIIRLYPDGKEEVVSDITLGASKFYFIYKPATVLHAGEK
jgi:hypothetical protein